jgi:hypothetical protein
MGEKGLGRPAEGASTGPLGEGWIDQDHHDRYTMDPAMNEDSEVLEGAEYMSLKCLMASCLDFAKERTALQHVGDELGAAVIIMPKFHAELAGEGIEYS